MKVTHWGRRAPLRLAAAALVLSGGGLIAAQPGLASPAHSASAPPPSATPRPAERVYRQVCGYCHGHNVAPIIRGRQLDPAAIEYFVRHGNGAMPAFKPTEISNQELAALAKWVSASKADPEEHGK